MEGEQLLLGNDLLVQLGPIVIDSPVYGPGRLPSELPMRVVTPEKE